MQNPLAAIERGNVSQWGSSVCGGAKCTLRATVLPGGENLRSGDGGAAPGPRQHLGVTAGFQQNGGHLVCFITHLQVK